MTPVASLVFFAFETLHATNVNRKVQLLENVKIYISLFCENLNRE